jgi:hypothetical protein
MCCQRQLIRDAIFSSFTLNFPKEILVWDSPFEGRKRDGRRVCIGMTSTRARFLSASFMLEEYSDKAAILHT